MGEQERPDNTGNPHSWTASRANRFVESLHLPLAGYLLSQGSCEFEARGMLLPSEKVTDRHSAHQPKVVQAFLQARQAKMEVVFMPINAPETNPHEWTWPRNVMHSIARGSIAIDPLAPENLIAGNDSEKHHSEW